jgi:HK97 family phage portal protein
MKTYLSERASHPTSSQKKVRIINRGAAPDTITRRIQPQQDNPLASKFAFSKDIATLLMKYDTLISTFYKYPWLSGSVMQIAKTISGSGYDIVNASLEIKQTKVLQKKKEAVLNFFRNISSKKEWNNIKDTITTSVKFQMTVIHFLLFGQAAWEVNKDDEGNVIGFDYIHGLVVPNITHTGAFKSPAFVVYPWNAPDRLNNPISYEKSTDIILFSFPSVGGEFVGRTYLEALLEYTIPADIYAAKSYLSLHKNHRSPAGIWIVEDTDEDEWEAVSTMIDTYYKGVENYASSAIVTSKKVEFKEFRSSAKDDAPYLEGRDFAKGEIAAVTGVPTSKLGVSEDMDKTDLQEMKRDFYESTIRPLIKILEETIDEQVIGRYFGTRELKLEFKEPDFLNGVERSSVARRYFEIGVFSPNDIRQKYLNEPPREGGDKYAEELRIGSNLFLPTKGGQNGKSAEQGIASEVGGAPRDRNSSEKQERQPGNVGHTNATESVRNVKISRADFFSVLDEISLWEKFTTDILLGKRNPRKFEFRSIPPLLSEAMLSEADYAFSSTSSITEKLQWIYLITSTTKQLLMTFFDVVEDLEIKKENI